MPNLDILLKEIVELSAVKSAYNYYLASSRSLTEVENATQVQHNSRILTKTLTTLHAKLLHEKQQLDKPTKNQLINKTIMHTANEKNAILHFNRDRRFTITE